MPETPVVRPGQVYRDRDPRSQGRTIRVDRVEGDYAYGTDSTMRQTRILVRRLISRSYELLEDVPALGDDNTTPGPA